MENLGGSVIGGIAALTGIAVVLGPLISHNSVQKKKSRQLLVPKDIPLEGQGLELVLDKPKKKKLRKSPSLTTADKPPRPDSQTTIKSLNVAEEDINDLLRLSEISRSNSTSKSRKNSVSQEKKKQRKNRNSTPSVPSSSRSVSSQRTVEDGLSLAVDHVAVSEKKLEPEIISAGSSDTNLTVASETPRHSCITRSLIPQVSITESEYTQLLERISTLESQLEVSKQSQGNLLDQVTILKDSNTLLSSSLSRTQHQSKEECSKLNKDLLIMTNQKNTMETSISKLTNELKNDKLYIDQLSTELKRERAELDTLRKEIHDQLKFKIDSEEAQMVIKQMKKENLELQQQTEVVNSLNLTVQSLKGELESVTDILNDVTTELKSSKEDYKMLESHSLQCISLLDQARGSLREYMVLGSVDEIKALLANKATIIEVPREVIKEVLVEVVKEVPVEVVKEILVEVPIEVVKEVQVDMVKEVIKEVPVEKMVEVTSLAAIAEKEELESKIYELRQQLEFAQQSVNALTKQFDVEPIWRSTPDDKSREIEVLTDALKGANIQVEKLTDVIRDSTLQESALGQQSLINSLSATLQDTIAEKENFEIKFAKLTSELKEVTKSLHTTQSQNETLLTKVNKLTGELKAKNENQDCEIYQAFEVQQSLVRSLTISLDDSKSQNNSLLEKLKILKEEVEESTLKQDNSSLTVAGQTTLISSLSRSLSESFAEIDGASTSIMALEAQILRVEASKAEVDNLVVRLTKSLETRSEQVHRLEKQLFEAKKASSEGVQKDLMMKVYELEQKLLLPCSKCESMAGKIRMLESVERGQEAVINSLKVEIRTANDKLAVEQQRHEEEKCSIAKRATSNEKKCADLCKEREVLQEEVNAFQELIGPLSHSVQIYAEEVAQLHKTVMTFEDRVINLEKQRTDLLLKIKEFSEKSVSNENEKVLQSLIDELTNTKNYQAITINSLMTEVEGYTATLESYKASSSTATVPDVKLDEFNLSVIELTEACAGKDSVIHSLSIALEDRKSGINTASVSKNSKELESLRKSESEKLKEIEDLRGKLHDSEVALDVASQGISMYSLTVGELVKSNEALKQQVCSETSSINPALKKELVKVYEGSNKLKERLAKLSENLGLCQSELVEKISGGECQDADAVDRLKKLSQDLETVKNEFLARK